MSTIGRFTDHEPFHIPGDSAGDWRHRLLRTLRAPLERLMSFPELNRTYGRARAATVSGESFFRGALAALDVGCRVMDSDLRRIPAAGPLIVVANHPLGGIDGLLLMDLLSRVRSNVKVLANHLLAAVPELSDWMLPVDPYGGAAATSRNAFPIRSAIRWVKQGGVLGVFPAGDVSTFRWQPWGVSDPPWSDTIGRLVQHTGATVLPVFFEGSNSAAFHAAGMIHPRCRTLMLPRELLRKRGTVVRVRIGNPIPPDRLARFRDPAELITYLRVRTYLLAARSTRPSRTPSAPGVHSAPPVAAAEDPDQMAAEVTRLPLGQNVTSGGPLAVFHAPSDQIPTVLREIGRLREITFRGVGEGTGTPRDLDRFDGHYRHLFVWNHHTREVVGAYRMGLTDQILSTLGLDGLYTRSLFHFRRELLDQIGPAIELGRSFVRPEYQREYAPLMLLWKGIGHFAAANSRYRMLFGPVSISNNYQCLSKHLLMAFLRMNRFREDLARWITPRNVPRLALPRHWDQAATGTVVRSVDEVSELVAEVEADRLSMPVLLRQYLRLNARCLGFNVDPDFGDVLDALMLVDLAGVDRPILNRYMGTEGSAAFLRRHAAAQPSSQSPTRFARRSR